jgi:hypothetical protein
MLRLINIKIPGSRKSENYECSDISYGNSFSLILTSSYLLILGVEVLVLQLIKFNDTHTHTHSRYGHSGQAISPSQRPIPDNIKQSKPTDIHAPSGIRYPNPSKRETENTRFKPRGHWDRIIGQFCVKIWTKTLPDGCGKWLSQMYSFINARPRRWSNISTR